MAEFNQDVQDADRFIQLCLHHPETLKQHEDAIAKVPGASLYYAMHVIYGPWPKGEDAIASDAQASYQYARHVLKGPFPKGEAAIASDANAAYWYALSVLKGPFVKGNKNE